MKTKFANLGEKKVEANSSQKTRYLATTAIFAAMITVMTAYICHIPVGANGGYVHFGDSLIYIAASILPAPYAFAAAAIGGGMADVLTAPMWAPATIIIKMAITIPFTNKKDSIVNLRNVLATVLAFVISAVGYWIAEGVLFGSFVAFFTSVSGSIVQSGGSAIIFIIFGKILDKSGFKKTLFQQ